MIILEVSTLNSISSFANVQPFLYEFMPGRVTYASWWSSVFGMDDGSRSSPTIVQAFIRDLIIKYNEASTFSNCKSQEGSFFWDNDSPNQRLYVHFEHEYEGWNALYQYGTFAGFSDKELVYLDEQEYLPIIESTPNVAQSQDIDNYNKLKFMTGNAVLKNTSIIESGKRVGLVDYFINANVYGNDAFLYYYPDSKLDSFGNGDRSELIRVGSFFIDDYDYDLQKFTFKLQDKRKANNVKILSDKFTEQEIQGDPIPLMYGQVREAEAIITNSEIITGDVNYRAALILTSIGTIEVNIDDIWTVQTPSSLNLSTGEFSLSQYGDVGTSATISDNGNNKVRITSTGDFANSKVDQKVNCVFTSDYDDAIYTIIVATSNYIDINLEFSSAIPTVTASVFNGARNSSGSPRDCRLLNPVGVVISKISDIIIDLNLRYLGDVYNSDNYNIPEWTTETAFLTSGGIVFKEQIYLHDAVRILQNGSNVGFRYEIDASNKRTIRIDDPDRVKTGWIYNVDIQNIDTLPVKSNSSLVYANVEVKHSQSFNSGRFLTVDNDDFRDQVLRDYKEQDTKTIETVLNNATDANSRAAYEALKVSKIPRIITLVLSGEDSLKIRILDTRDVEATPGEADIDTLTIEGRKYLGFIEGKVVGIAPDLKQVKNTIQLQIKET
jgi:hypothetical protein